MWVLVAAVVAVAMLLAGVRLVGITPYAVLSGSMEPAFPVGSMIYVKAVDPESIEVGDPITFYLDKESGVIAALRHIHLDPETAGRLGLHDKQMVRVEIGGLRGAVLNNVLVRVSEQYAPEMHIDVEEANALGVKNDDRAYILLDDGKS